MKNSHTWSRAKNRQAGYALLLVMFFVALLVLAVAAAAPSVLTQVRREKEQQMIWRGKQYALGVQRYYTKLHRFPTSLDDLYKPKTGIRFMRQAYKDPTNKEDGAWRLIYVGPNGQLIGSLKAQPPNLNGAGGGSQNGILGGMATQGQSTFGGIGSNTSQTPGSGMFSSAGASVGAPAAGTPSAADTSGGTPTDQGQTYTDTGNIVGGNIIGVGGKVNQKSIIWYDKAHDYRHFEFIWDPSVDQLTGQRVGQIPPNPGTNVTNQQGSGTNSNPTNPNQNPGAPPMTPPPTPPEQ
jgi:type II secretory pathway pseudopilin PulG